jgi:hypothetical protein
MLGKIVLSVAFFPWMLLGASMNAASEAYGDPTPDDSQSVSTSKRNQVEEVGAKKKTDEFGEFGWGSLKGMKNASLIQAELRSAKSIATTGAVLYSVGFVGEVIGVIVLMNDIEASHRQPSYSYYGSSNSSRDPSLTGLYIILFGGVTNLAGSITANVGGSKAHSVLAGLSDGIVPPFNGWDLFWGYISFSIASTVFSNLDVPTLVPTCLSLTGFSLSIMSLVSAVSYTNKAYVRSLVKRDIRLLPIVDCRTLKITGAALSASF